MSGIASEIVRLFNTKEASEHLHMSHEYVRRLCREGVFPCRKVRGKFYMTTEQLNAILEGSN